MEAKVTPAKKAATLYVVHCVDTEGPLSESLTATFERIETAFGLKLEPSKETLVKIQNRELDLNGREEAVARMVAPELLEYNSSWERIGEMLNEALSESFRTKTTDDDGNGWVYSWHCMDHVGYAENPRQKEVGYGNVFRYYRKAIEGPESSSDELNWHFHPSSLLRNPLHAATSYANSYPRLYEILCRRILDEAWFPVVNRPGFHAERPDSHFFLEQWMPFDYANQAHEDEGDQLDALGGRFGDWRRAPRTWRGYHPDFHDYQSRGDARRTIFRCLNMGTRLRLMTRAHVREAFTEAAEHGAAVLAFADHDYRDIRPDVAAVRGMLEDVRGDFPNVRVIFAGAEAAARAILGVADAPKPQLSISLSGNRLFVELQAGELQGSQPFLALRDRDGNVFHDNLDVAVPNRAWSYTLDEHTLHLDRVATAGVGAAGRHGGFHVARIDVGR